VRKGVLKQTNQQIAIKVQ